MAEKKVAVVTGASRGIGRAIALELGRRGNFVVVNYNGSAEKAEAVKQEIEAAGGEACAMQCDVSDYGACEAFMKDIIKEYKRIDILVNNAGVTRDGLLMQMKEEDFDAVVDTNLKGAFHTIRFAARQMLKQRSGPDHQSVLRGRPQRQRGPGKLQRFQSGDHRPYQIRGQGTGLPGHYGQRHCPRIYRDGDDSGAAGGDQGGHLKGDPTAEIRKTGRCGPGRSLPGL